MLTCNSAFSFTLFGVTLHNDLSHEIIVPCTDCKTNELQSFDFSIQQKKKLSEYFLLNIYFDIFDKNFANVIFLKKGFLRDDIYCRTVLLN